MQITALHVHTAPMANSWLSEAVIANPMSIYPEYWERRSSWFGKMTAAVIEVILSDGTRGYGFVGGGRGHAVEPLLDAQFRRLVVGKPVDAIETIHEQLYRASVFYGRGGLTQCVISGIDIALHDAKGRLEGKPALSPSRRQLPVYYTGNDPTALGDFGIRDMKIAVPYGPAHGEEGMTKNEAVVAKARETLDSGAFLALDIYMAWNVEYALRMYERIEKYRIAWLEEPVPPDDYAGYREIRKRINTKVTGGEHEYTLSGFERLIGEGCVDIVQPDIYRAGGPTACAKIAAMASNAGIQLVCHGIGTPTYHFLAGNSEALTPFAEYVDIYQSTVKDWILTGDPRPSGGILSLSDRPGFGYELSGKSPVATIW